VQRDSAPRRAQGEGSAADAEGCAATVSSKWAKGTGSPAGDECYNLTTQPIAGTIGNRGLRSHTELDGHGAYIPVQQPVVSIQGAATRINPSSGPDGIGVSQLGVAYTLEARSEVQAVAQPVPFTKAKRAQSTTDDETWVDGKVNPTISLFDQGDTRATTVAVAFNDTSATLKGGSGERGYPDPSDGNGHGIVGSAMTVRRLTPTECERLQGFPDGYTAIPWRRKPADQCPDGLRYKALGNSMAVNCMAWIGERIAASEAQHAGA
jgi:DNA (cytosine-5)-methyltransferase 1